MLNRRVNYVKKEPLQLERAYIQSVREYSSFLINCSQFSRSEGLV